MGRRANVPALVSQEKIEQAKTLPYTLMDIPLESFVHRRNYGERTLRPNKDGCDLLRSISGYGFIPDREPSVVLEPDGKYEVICGNRRITACKVLQSNESIASFFTTPGYVVSKPNMKGITVREITSITCRVYNNITLEQEKILRSDHIGLEALTTWEKYCNVVDLYDAGETLKSIEALTGVKSATINRYNGIHDLPEVVEQEFFKQCHKLPNMNLGQKELDPLHQAWIADRDAMLAAKRHGELTDADVFLPPEERASKAENGRYRIFRNWGEKSQVLWNSYVAAYEEKGDASKAATTATTMRKKKDVDKQVENYHACPTILNALKWARGEDVNLQYVYLEEMSFRKDAKVWYDENSKFREFVLSLTQYVNSCGYDVPNNDLDMLATVIVDNLRSKYEEEDIIIEQPALEVATD